MVFSPLLVALLLLGSFAWMPMSYYRMVSWPWVGLWQGAFLLAAGGLLWRLRQGERPVYPLGHGLDGAIALTLAMVALSASQAPSPGAAWSQFTLALPYALLAYSLRQALKEGTLLPQTLLQGVALVAMGSAVISLSQWRPTPEMWLGGNFATALRNPHPLGHHNFVGGYFGLTLPWAIAQTLQTPGRWRWFWGVGSGGIAMALFVSGSRGAALGAVGAGIVAAGGFLLAKSPAQSPAVRLGQRLAALGGVALLGIAALANPRTRDSLWALVGGGGSQVELSQVDGPLVDRLFMAQTGWNLVGHRPLWGAGPGNMARLFNHYRPLEMGAGLDHVQQLHNTPIHLLGELGWPGLLLYGLWLALVGRLVWQGWHHCPQQRVGIGAIALGFLAYGLSSLTDYQLENIPITLTLLAGVILLVALGPDPTPPLGATPQRTSSLGVLMAIALVLPAWVRLDGALWLNHAALRAIERTDLVTAQYRWEQATTLLPWDPTAPALAAQTLLDVEGFLPGFSRPPDLAPQILANLKAAYIAAPEDVYFNHNLAVRLLPLDPMLAKPFAQRVVQLLPRTRNHPYILLGQVYLGMGDTEAAITAFALEELISPGFTARPHWQEAPYLSLLPAVVDKAIAIHTALLERLPPDHPHRNLLYEQTQLLRWWHQRPLLPLEGAGQRPGGDHRLSPLALALLQGEHNPELALVTLAQGLGSASEEEQAGLRLLQAWFDPDTYLESYLASVAEDRLDADTAQTLGQHIRDHRTLRPWLQSLREPSEPRQRRGLAFAYRNWEANRIDRILFPLPLERYTLVALLPVFQSWPREFPALDQQVEAIKAAELGLVHPTRNGYRLPEPDLDF